MATHSSILVWEIPWTEQPGGYSPWGCRVGHNSATEHAQHTDAQKKGWKGWTGEVSGHRVLIKRGPGNRGPTEYGTTHEATSGMSS